MGNKDESGGIRINLNVLHGSEAVMKVFNFTGLTHKDKSTIIIAASHYVSSSFQFIPCWGSLVYNGGG